MISGWLPRPGACSGLLATCLALGVLTAFPVSAQGRDGGSGGGGTESGSIGAADRSASGASNGAGTSDSVVERDPARPGTAGGPALGGTMQEPMRPGSAAQASEQRPSPSGQAQGSLTPRGRIALQRQQRAADGSSERDREQLQDLNEISRELVPSATVPAPGLEARGGVR